MLNVIFVSPLFHKASARFLSATAGLDGIRLGLISMQPLSVLPEAVRTKVKGHYQVGNCMDLGQLLIAVKTVAGQLGGVDRLFAAIEDLQEHMAVLRSHLNIEGMGPEQATNFRDKSQMKAVMREHGVPCARSRLIESPQQAREFVNQVGFPIIVKPPAGAGARGTFRINDAAMLDQYLQVYMKGSQILFEEFIQGEEHSCESVCINGEVKWISLSRYYPTPLEVIKNPWIQWCVLLPRDIDHPRWDEIRIANQAALKALGMTTGLSHMEWFRRKDGSVAISEVGARPPGAQFMSLMSYAHDRDFYAAWAELMVFHRFDPPSRDYAVGAAYLRGKGGVRVKAVHGLDQAQKEVGSVVVEAKLPKPGQPAASTYEGDGYVIVRHPDTEIVKKVLKRLITVIKVEYA